VVAAVLLQIHSAWGPLTSDVYPNREASRIFGVVSAQRHEPCVLNSYAALRLVGYTDAFADLTALDSRGDCAVLFAIGSLPAHVVSELDRNFPYRVGLPAKNPGTLWSVVPTACWTKAPPATGCRVPPPATRPPTHRSSDSR
jgi:hypothetical protein